MAALGVLNAKLGLMVDGIFHELGTASIDVTATQVHTDGNNVNYELSIEGLRDQVASILRDTAEAIAAD
ncbi:hypothetical protein [Gordonia westfalica]|uniref:Uncharacterized protein n=1 Tax=Gordonia westfalica TaxID=158898 RepID=A0A1H2DQP7_9ACTN|nr:hypothetical protein [Gordonia westfalica]SDT85071.1 hypothetical protein SAMN04488548_1152 [Gordonia westfalica]SDT89597.1 hypothetical protein SAMN04488548_12750 [Gordonia westfalica]SDU77287.1 hypothetical protein SAMN04488548_13515 [Gordonia westfalica]SDU77297.1 hypothetical protein SAMN04488548_13518 [Gordonia westfalica]